MTFALPVSSAYDWIGVRLGVSPQLPRKVCPAVLLPGGCLQ